MEFIEPCACKPALDLQALIKGARGDNDNAQLGFVTDHLANVIATDFVMQPVRGKLFASTINVAGNLTLVVEGSATLFVEGAMTVAGVVAFQFDPEGSLDVVVGGDLFLGGAQTQASDIRPSQLRYYVAPDRQVTLGLPAGFMGTLYAPQAHVVTASSEIHGALLVGDLTAGLPLDIHYDTSIPQAASHCRETSRSAEP
jgi:hypothetical protein